MNLNKMAEQDATRWAYAEMFFGEGAGTRRKLLQAEINKKVATIPGYVDQFNDAYVDQDFAKHAIKAARERKSLDRGTFIKRNTRGLLTGNRRSLTTGVATAVTVYAVLVQTGLDEPLKVEAKKAYAKAKTKFNDLKQGGSLKSV